MEAEALMAELLNLDRVRSVLEEFADEAAVLYRGNLTRDNSNASGRLFSSVACRMEQDGRVFLVIMRMEEYWRYLEEGTRPHWPPVSAILKWIQVKPVIPRPDANGRIPTQKQLAFLISRKIARVGTEGRHGLRDAKQQAFDLFRQRLAEALAMDVHDSFISSLREQLR